MTPANPVRGEVLAKLGGREVRLCLTFGALARMEAALSVRGLAGVATRLPELAPLEADAVVRALVDPFCPSCGAGDRADHTLTADASLSELRRAIADAILAALA